MDFKNFIKEETIIVKLPNSYKTNVIVNLKEYKELVSNSKLKNDKKIILENVVSNKEIPIYSEQEHRCFMLNLNDPKKRARELKSREDKELCGVLINAMCIKENNTEKYKNIKWNWEIPSFIWNI